MDWRGARGAVLRTVCPLAEIVVLDPLSRGYCRRTTGAQVASCPATPQVEAKNKEIESEKHLSSMAEREMVRSSGRLTVHWAVTAHRAVTAKGTLQRRLGFGDSAGAQQHWRQGRPARAEATTISRGSPPAGVLALQRGALQRELGARPSCSRRIWRLSGYLHHGLQGAVVSMPRARVRPGADTLPRVLLSAGNGWGLGAPRRG